MFLEFDGVSWVLVSPSEYAELQAHGDFTSRIAYGSLDFVEAAVLDVRQQSDTLRTDGELREIVRELLAWRP